MKYLERTIFAIEKAEDNEKVVHFLGYGYYGEVTQYITDVTMERLYKIYETYDNGRRPKEVCQLSEDLPEGVYIYMGSETN